MAVKLKYLRIANIFPNKLFIGSVLEKTEITFSLEEGSTTANGSPFIYTFTFSSLAIVSKHFDTCFSNFKLLNCFENVSFLVGPFDAYINFNLSHTSFDNNSRRKVLDNELAAIPNKNSRSQKKNKILVIILFP